MKCAIDDALIDESIVNTRAKAAIGSLDAQKAIERGDVED